MPLKPEKTAVSPPILRQCFWIHVKDHLPDDELAVLVAAADGEIDLAFHAENKWFPADARTHPLENITHWMDLPAPPGWEGE